VGTFSATLSLARFAFQISEYQLTFVFFQVLICTFFTGMQQNIADKEMDSLVSSLDLQHYLECKF
jgi:hypothetical protein